MLNRLQAINQMLSSVGEQTILVEVEGAGDYANCNAVLDAVTRDVLYKGWKFNTDRGVSWTHDNTGRIGIPPTALRVTPTDPNKGYVQRGYWLYDTKANTDLITGPVKVDVIWLVVFDEVPYEVQRIIVAQACAKYQQSYVGSEQLDKFSQAGVAQVESDAYDADDLRDETRKVLFKGWHFNTDKNYELSPDFTGRVAVPANVLSLDPSDPHDDLVIRDGFLYDRDEHTNVLSRKVEVDITWDMPFASVPYAVQRLITAQAQLKYQRRLEGKAALDKMNADEVLEAGADAADAETGVDDYNMLDNPDLAYLRRRSVRRIAL